MSLPSPSALIFALWIVTAALAAPLLAGAFLGGRLALAQRRIVRGALAIVPALLVAGLLLPDPLGGRPLLSLGDGGAAPPATEASPEVRTPRLPGEPSAPEAACASPSPSAPAEAEAAPLPRHPVAVEAIVGTIPAAVAGPDAGAAPEDASPREIARGRSRTPAPGAAVGLPAEPAADPLPAGSAADLPMPAPSPRSGGERVDAAAMIRALLFIWLTGALLQLLRVGAAAGAIARWRRSSTALGSTRGVPLIDPTSAALPVRIIPRLRGAAAVGVLSPEIWLPAHWSARLDRPGLHAVIAHEAAHHRSRDPLWRLVGALVTAVLWPHPLAHALARREESLSELVADRRVLAAGAGPRRYAELLARLAADAAGQPLALAAGVFGTRSPLERRIRMILTTPAGRVPRDGGWTAPALLGAVCAAVLGVATCFPLVGIACDPPIVPAPEVVGTIDGGLLDWVVAAPAADSSASDDPLPHGRPSAETDALRTAIARIEAEIAARAADLERLRAELAARSAQHDRHAQAIAERAGAERAALEREMIAAEQRLAAEESALAGRPDDERVRQRIALAERRAELAQHVAELHARRQEELAGAHARLAEDQRELEEAAHEQLAERLAEMAELAEERDELIAERRCLAESMGDRASAQDLPAQGGATSSRRRALELELRALGRGFPEHAGAAAEAAELAAEEAAQAVEEALEELLAELHEEMAELHARLEDLPGLLEGLGPPGERIRIGEGELEGLGIEIDRLRGALDRERERSARLEAENRDLRARLEQLETGDRRPGASMMPSSRSAPAAPAAPSAPAATPAPPAPAALPTPAAPPAPPAPPAPLDPIR